MRFAEIISHKEAIDVLRQMADANRLPHALLISGPSGIGKMNLALAFAQYVNCTNRHDGDSCGECPSCRQQLSHNSPDILFIYPIHKKTKPKKQVSADYADEWYRYLDEYPFMPPEEWHRALDADNAQPMIYVADSEEVIHWLSLSSFSARFKIVVIWQPEKMMPETANKLLKIIEEPTEDSMFILVSNEPQNILPTIYSRTRPLNLKRLSDEEIYEWLLGKGVDESRAQEITRLAEGSLGQAASQVTYNAEKEEFTSAFQRLMRQAYACNIADLKLLSEDVANMKREKSCRFLAYCGRMIRENYIANISLPQLNRQTAEEMKFSDRFAPFIHEGNVEGISGVIDETINAIRRNANTKIVLLDMMLQIMLLIRTKRNQ